MPAIRTLLLDGHALAREGISRLLMGTPGLEVVAQGQDAAEAIGILQREAVDVVLVDIELFEDDLGPADWIVKLHHAAPAAHLVVLTNNVEPRMIHAAFRGGADGYLLKNMAPQDLADAIASAHQGLPVLSPEATTVLIRQVAEPIERIRHLTRHELTVLERVACGHNNPRIAADLGISISTVQFHIGNILRKLDVHNRTEAATFAVRHLNMRGERP